MLKRLIYKNNSIFTSCTENKTAANWALIEGHNIMTKNSFSPAVIMT